MNRPVATWKSIVVTFVLAVIFYVLAYAWVDGKQHRKGPWQVNFMTNNAGQPQLVIAQKALGISNVTVQFAGEQLAATNRTGVVSFTTPKQPTPFGLVAYDDLMFQPGSIALDCFGHLVEMVPSAFGLNGVRFLWTNDVVYSLSPTDKLSPEARKKLKGGYRR
ncbi:MAG TPA: hypothetical protein VNT99_05195 [Methylomirabilota bacterium]|nr:hypothetical protein [Methylomirabilota bacterium]